MWGAGHVFKVIVAPRHSEKFPYFLDRVKELNRQYATWSTVSEPQEERRDVLLLDVYGQLEAAYSTAQLCFIGATLVDVGGHNPLEAAMYSVPVCVGPYTSVIAEVVADMQGVDGIIDLTNEESIHSVVERVCRRDPELTDLGMRGATVWEKHRGATARIVKALTPHTGGV
jgi:3-deoxy-D-manno-octulosonic-acid transferase